MLYKGGAMPYQREDTASVITGLKPVHHTIDSLGRGNAHCTALEDIRRAADTHPVNYYTSCPN
jgi:hypothetical protein